MRTTKVKEPQVFIRIKATSSLYAFDEVVLEKKCEKRLQQHLKNYLKVREACSARLRRAMREQNDSEFVELFNKDVLRVETIKL